VCPAIAVFGILPRVDGFLGLCLTLGLVLVPFASLMAPPWRPLMCMAASVNFIPILSLTNQMTYNASNFWNGNLGILGGIAVAAIAFKIVPPVPPLIRTHWLLLLTLADLRRLVRRAPPGRTDVWEGRGIARLLALPEQAQPIQRPELASMVAVGKEILRLRRAAPRIIRNCALDPALEALAEGRSGQSIQSLEQVDRQLAALPSPLAWSRIVMSLRASILAICGQLNEFPACYDGKPTR
jgi:uncharacterized membrane protein YccC